MSKRIKCPRCDGGGYERDGDFCFCCEGNGEVWPESIEAFYGKFPAERPLPSQEGAKP